MNNLTSTEKVVLNNSSQARNVNVKLGDKIQEIIETVGVSGTPVNAVAAKDTLTISGITTDGETFTINNPAVAGVDTYEFLADAAQSKTSLGNIPINITSYAAKATGALTMATQPIAGDTITIGANTYIFVPVGTANSVGEVSKGADVAGAQGHLVAAINGTDGVNIPHPHVTASAFTANVCTITALIGGTDGNTIATTETLTAAGNVFAAATLGSGGNCSAANTVTAIIAAITASDTQGVGATAGAGTSVVITADVAGIVGNSITISDTMDNGEFTAAATSLTGGVDGTVAAGLALKADGSYLYICPLGNTTAQANWRRIALGNAF